jgi:hypothetical protein
MMLSSWRLLSQVLNTKTQVIIVHVLCGLHVGNSAIDRKKNTWIEGEVSGSDGM